jgi:hypothetical protein
MQSIRRLIDCNIPPNVDYAWSSYGEATKLVSSYCKGYMSAANNMKTNQKIAEFPNKHVPGS